MHAGSERTVRYQDARTWKSSSGRLGSVERLVGGSKEVFVVPEDGVGMEMAAQEDIIGKRHRKRSMTHMLDWDR